jgi:hypothetical protein
MRSSLLRGLAGFLAFGALLGPGALPALFAQGQAPPPPRAAGDPPKDPYRLSRNVHGDAKPVVLHADEIAAWPVKDFTGEHLAVLLRGTVLLHQNVVQARFQQGFAWVDVRQYRDFGQLHVLVYAEGEAKVDDGVEVHEVPRAVLDLTTRGELRLNSHKSKVVQQALADDPIVQRARSFGLAPPQARPPVVAAPARLPPAPAVTVQRTALQQPAPVPGTVKQPPPLPQVELPAFLSPDRPAPPPASPALPSLLKPPAAPTAGQ